METTLKARRGRPPQTVHGTMAAGNPVTGESVAWSDGYWHGTKRLVTEANYLCVTHEVLPVPGTGAYVVADESDPVAVYAVLAALVGPHGNVEGDIPTAALVEADALSMLDPDEFEDVA